MFIKRMLWRTTKIDYRRNMDNNNNNTDEVTDKNRKNIEVQVRT